MPDRWHETTLAEVVYLQRRRMDPSKVSPDTELLHWSIPALDETGGPVHEAASAIGSHKFEVAESCVLLSLLNPRIPRFAVAEGGNGVVCSTEFAALTPTGAVSLHFLACLVSAPSFFEPFLNLAQGTTKSRERVKPSDLLSIPLRVPSAPEQRRIVDLVGSIDTYIDSLETQISTTRTARSALLSELLSNPGDDWQESTLGDLASWTSGKSLHASKRKEDGVFPVLGASGEISRTDDWLIDCDAVLVGRVGAVGAIQRTSGRVWVSDNALIARPSSLVDVDFLHVLLECFDFTPIVSGNAQPVITQGRLRSQVTSAPPLVEQRRIVNLVGSFDEQISSLESQAESVRTFRQSVLSELLSGERLLDESYDVAVGL